MTLNFSAKNSLLSILTFNNFHLVVEELALFINKGINFLQGAHQLFNKKTLN